MSHIGIGGLSEMRRVPVPALDAPFTDDETALDVAALLGEPAFTIHTSHRHNGSPMLPPSAVAAVGYWESCLGDNVPLPTEAEIAKMQAEDRFYHRVYKGE